MSTQRHPRALLSVTDSALDRAIDGAKARVDLLKLSLEDAQDWLDELLTEKGFRAGDVCRCGARCVIAGGENSVCECGPDCDY